MIGRVLLSGLISGLLAGALAFALQAAKVTPLIHLAETYESFPHGAAPHPSPPPVPAAPGGAAVAPGIGRTLLTFAASLLVGAGYGLALAGAIALSGRDPGPGEGILWGIGGYAAFVLAPALALPPQLPGMAEGSLAARQLLWLAIAGATCAGLAVAVFARGPWLRALGLALVVAPHLLTAPAPGTADAGPPAPLAAAHAAATLAIAGVFWAVLGLAVAALMRRFAGRAAAP